MDERKLLLYMEEIIYVMKLKTHFQIIGSKLFNNSIEISLTLCCLVTKCNSTSKQIKMRD